MPVPDTATNNLHGRYRDVLKNERGQVLFDSGWHANLIVNDCRRLLAAFAKGETGVLGIQELRVGAGSPAWDDRPEKPAAMDVALVDANYYTVKRVDLTIDYLDDTGALSTQVTNRLQIAVKLGPKIPSWPDSKHASGTLREFGLVGQIGSTPFLINVVRHAAITKDPSSTLERTIWLNF